MRAGASHAVRRSDPQLPDERQPPAPDGSERTRTIALVMPCYLFYL